MKVRVVVEGTKIINYGYSEYIIKEGQELHEIDNYPSGARKQDVYWDGSKVELKTQSMKDAEALILKEEEDKKELDKNVLEKLIDALEKMMDGIYTTDFNILIDKLKE